jgi:hypothetical protein
VIPITFAFIANPFPPVIGGLISVIGLPIFGRAADALETAGSRL